MSSSNSASSSSVFVAAPAAATSDRDRWTTSTTSTSASASSTGCAMIRIPVLHQHYPPPPRHHHQHQYHYESQLQPSDSLSPPPPQPSNTTDRLHRQGRWRILPAIGLLIAILLGVRYQTTVTTTNTNTTANNSSSSSSIYKLQSHNRLWNRNPRQRIQQQQQQQQPYDNSDPWVLRIDAGSGPATAASSSSSSLSLSSSDSSSTTNATGTNPWLADAYYSGGEMLATGIDADSLSLWSENSIENTSATLLSNEDLVIFETSRSGSFWGANSFRYDVPLRNGIYNLTFYFIEPDVSIQAGDRVFDILIERNPTYSKSGIDIVNLTMHQQPPLAFVQIDQDNVTIQDGILTMEFRRNTDHLPTWAIFRRIWYRQFRRNAPSPIVSGIEIILDRIDLPVFTDQNLTLAPIGPPVPAPVMGAPTTVLETIRINVGATTTYTDPNFNTWMADTYYTNGQILQVNDVDNKGDNQDNGTTTSIIIPRTLPVDSTVLLSMRTGSSFKYNIPVPPGNYDIRMYFIEYNGIVQIGERIFDIKIESMTVYENIDVLSATNGVYRTALVLSKPYEVTDGDVTIEFVSLRGGKYFPIVSAIEIELLGVHYAHAVTGGPYRGVIDPSTGQDFATIKVDGSSSHTHASGLELVDYVWKLVPSVLATNGTIIGRGETTSLSLPLGEHIVALEVADNGGNDSKDLTIITIYGSDYPDVTRIEPQNGPIFGGNFIQIIGSGFLFPSNVTIVQFGTQNLTGAYIKILNANTIKLRVPSVKIPSLIPVSVVTPNGESKTAIYSYESSVPIRFNSEKIAEIEKPLRIKFGPDGKLYVSTGEGKIYKMTLDDEYNVVDTIVAQVASSKRYITGLAFDPTDPDPTRIYFASNYFFHGDWESTSGYSINARIDTARGAELEVVTQIVTGLPVADLDHGIMALEFGDHGELYICAGSNTNGGIPGPLTSKSLQKDSILSSAILVAHLKKPGFNGTVTYDADDDGNQVGALGSVEVYAPGFRNPFGMVLHSNGYLYVTDNGPNVGFGEMAMGCDGKKIPDVEEDDRLHLVEPDKYYGQPNLKRGLTDPRQCVWRAATEARTSANGYTPPIGRPLSSTTGVLEFHSNHFDGQLRYSLIAALYKGGLYRTVLSTDGRSVLPESNPPVLLTGDDTLDITQGPDGSLFDTRYVTDDIFVYNPFDFFVPSTPTIYTVFPRRGSLSGGNILTVYGINLWGSSSTTKILMDGNECKISLTPVAPTAKKIRCIVPASRLVVGHITVDVVATVSNTNPTVAPITTTFESGYRYITGKPAL